MFWVIMQYFSPLLKLCFLHWRGYASHLSLGKICVSYTKYKYFNYISILMICIHEHAHMN